MLHAVFCLLFLSFFSFGEINDGLEPPVNPYLANSPWPMTHRNSYTQASSPYAGLEAGNNAQSTFLKGSPVAVTLNVSPKYANGDYVVWGSTLKNIFKINPNGQRWEYIEEVALDKASNQISGAYTLLDRDGVFFVPRGSVINAFSDKAKGDAYSGIQKQRSFQIPSSVLLSKDEAIVGLNITYDGHLVFATGNGLVGLVSRSFDKFYSVRLPGEQSVSNSIAVDEEGGIYVVTSKEIHRVEWDGTNLSLTWSTAYQSEIAASHGRLGVGSGTTPTLMGKGSEDKLVVIADGQKLMHLVYFWRKEIPADWKGLVGRDRRIAAEVPITFGDANARTSTTEQSLLVRGHEALVVNNAYGEIHFPKIFTELYDKLLIYFSNKKGVAPYGVEKFVWNSNDKKLESQWVNTAVSCPNSIPSMSAASGLMYCVGQHEEVWTIEALDWKTGRLVFRTELGKGNEFNSYYAATEIGYDQSILSGTVWGTIRVR